MKSDFLILGADGMQGYIVARDLLESEYRVTLSDIYKTRMKGLLGKFKKTSTFAYADLRDIDQVKTVIQKSGADVVINCAEGDLNLNVYHACLQTQSHVVDLGSRFTMTKSQLSLDKNFKKIGKTAITGCGSVPGIGNIMLAHAVQKFDSIKTINAGFAWDSNIKKFYPPFSIESVLAEFTSPAPILEDGKFKKKDPYRNSHVKYFKTIGSQKIFLVEHPETFTFYHYYKAWGLKNIRFYAGFPEHSVRMISTLIELGFHKQNPVKMDGINIFPDELLSQLLKKMTMPHGYKEWENIWVEIIGRSNHQEKKVLMECIVPYLKGWDESGCNIDTGFPASIIAQMIKYGDISKRGSYSPEGCVPTKLFFKQLRKKKLRVYQNGAVIS